MHATLKDPRSYLTFVTFLLLYVPAGYGWHWAMQEGYLIHTVFLAFALGMSATVLRLAARSLLEALRFGLLMFSATPALGVYLYATAGLPLLWWPLLAVGGVHAMIFARRAMVLLRTA